MLMYRSYSSSFKTSRNRPCARCVWTDWRTWSSCVAMAPASCVGTEWANAPSAARPSSVASSCTRPSERTLSSFKAHTDHARNATSTPAAAILTAPESASHVLFYTTDTLLILLLFSGGISVTKQGKENLNWLKSILLFCYCTSSEQPQRCLLHGRQLVLPPRLCFPTILCCFCFYLTILNFFSLLEYEVQIHILGYELMRWISSLDFTVEQLCQQTRMCEGGEVNLLPFDVKFSCICCSQCQLQSSFIVFVNLYASVLVSEAPDVDFKYLILSCQYGKFETRYCLHHLTAQWVFHLLVCVQLGCLTLYANCPCSPRPNVGSFALEKDESGSKRVLHWLLEVCFSSVTKPRYSSLTAR